MSQVADNIAEKILLSQSLIVQWESKPKSEQRDGILAAERSKLQSLETPVAHIAPGFPHPLQTPSGCRKRAL
jgi:hypothetical protein